MVNYLRTTTYYSTYYLTTYNIRPATTIYILPTITTATSPPFQKNTPLGPIKTTNPPPQRSAKQATGALCACYLLTHYTYTTYTYTTYHR